MFTFNISLAVLLSAALLLSEKKLQVEACSFNLDCSSNHYCCRGMYPWVSSVCRFGGCDGDSCSWNSDCGGTGEKCLKHVCTISACSSNFDCSLNEYCCKQRYYYQSHICGDGGCVGQPCNSDSDCGGPGECCSSNKYCTKSSCTKCSSNLYCGYKKYCCKKRYSWQSHVCGSGGCVGQPCSSDSDCGGPGECCSSSKYCTKSSCREEENILSWFIPVCVVSGIVGLAILVACIYGVKRAMRGRAQPGIVVRQQQTGAAVIALQNTQTAESNPEQLQMPPPAVYFNQGQDLPAASKPVAQVPSPAYTKY